MDCDGLVEGCKLCRRHHPWPKRPFFTHLAHPGPTGLKNTWKDSHPCGQMTVFTGDRFPVEGTHGLVPGHANAVDLDVTNRSQMLAASIVGSSAAALSIGIVLLCKRHFLSLSFYLKGLGQSLEPRAQVCVLKHPGTNGFCLHGHFKMSLLFTGVHEYPQPSNHEAAVGMAFACLLLPVSNDREGLWQRR